VADINEVDLQSVNSWLEAVTGSKGYEDGALALDLIKKFETDLVSRLDKSPIGNKSVRNEHLLTMFNKVNSGGEVSIADFGGGNGYMADWIRLEFPNTKILYTVYETTKIAEGYNKLSKDLEIDFVDANRFGEKLYDLIIISGTLHFLENWKEILKLSSRIAKNVLLMRVPMTDADDHEFLIQNANAEIYGLSHASWPIIFFSRGLLLKEFQNMFGIVLELTDIEESFPSHGKKFFMHSLLLKTQSN
jgi:putative methyltransferase (TIGR04325 family)